MGGENIYTWFEYISQTIFSHTQAQVKGLKIADTINVIERIDGTTGNIYLLLLPSLHSILMHFFVFNIIYFVASWYGRISIRSIITIVARGSNLVTSILFLLRFDWI